MYVKTKKNHISSNNYTLCKFLSTKSLILNNEWNFFFQKCSSDKHLLSFTESELKVRHPIWLFNRRIILLPIIHLSIWYIKALIQLQDSWLPLPKCPDASKCSKCHFHLDMFVHSQSRFYIDASYWGEIANNILVYIVWLLLVFGWVLHC